MSLDAPAALWGWLILPVIVLLYLLRSRRQQVPQSTLILWQRARRDLAAQRPARRLERSVLLLLQLLIAALLVLALARPRLAAPGGAPLTVLVVDVSASMQATDVAPSRFAIATALAREQAAAARGEVMVISAGARPVVVAPPGDALAARAALAALRPTDGPGRLDLAITLALGQRRGGAPPRVAVFTDRAGAPIPGVAYHVVGRSSRNVGISRVAVEREGDRSVLSIQVLNAGPALERVPVAVALDGVALTERLLAVPAGAVASLTVPVAGAGSARIALRVADLLAVDNVAYAVVGAPLPRVLLAGAPDRVLLRALEAIPVKVVSPRVTPETLSAADIVVLNRAPPTELPPGNYLLLGTTAPNLPLTAAGTTTGGAALRWTARHPVMRYVDLRGVVFGEVLRLVPRGGVTLAEGDGPLLWAYDGEGIRAVVAAFTLEQSDLPLHVAFPILLSNIIGWLGGADRIVPVGETVTLPAGGVPQAVLRAPDGTATTIPAVSGRIVLPGMERVGLYTLQRGDRRLTLAVNPVAEESVIAPLAPRGEPAPAALQEVGARRDIWTIVLLLAIGALLAEWALWLRTLPPLPRWPAPPHVAGRRTGDG
ncbi:MAG TPA: VWA domain-containing protein [bacterium]|nr:VWA domain-containing protein [bacterium]